MAPSYLRTDASIITSFTARDSQNVIKENIYSYKGKISIDITNAFNAWKTMVQRNLFLCIHLLILTQYKPIPKRVFFFFLFCFVFCFFFFFFFFEVVYNSRYEDFQNFGSISSRPAAEPRMAIFWIREENSSAWRHWIWSVHLQYIP